MNQELIKEIAGVIKEHKALFQDEWSREIFSKRLSDLFEREDNARLKSIYNEVGVKLNKPLGFNPSQFKKECGVK